MEFDYFTYIVLPLLIIVARIMDVSIGTIRMIFVSKGFKKIAPILGFFEILIWIIAIRQIMINLTHWILYVAYASGFALGNYIGIIIEEKLSVGKVIFRIITQKDATNLINKLKEKNFAITYVDAEGREGRVKLIFTVIKRKKSKELISYIKEFNPKAFYTIEDVKFANQAMNQEEIVNQKKLFQFQRRGK